MLRRLLIATLPAFYLLVTACSGGSETPPPQPQSMQQPQYQPMFTDLYNAAKDANASCSQEYSPAFIMLAMQFQQSRAQQGPGGTPMQPQLPPTIQPQGGKCNNDLMNLMLQFMTIRQPDGQMYAEQQASRQWLARFLAGIVYRIGAGIQQRGININDPQMRNYLLAAGANQVRTYVIPQMGQMAGPAQQGFNYFAGIN